jgi:hypothetical protein
MRHYIPAEPLGIAIAGPVMNSINQRESNEYRRIVIESQGGNEAECAVQPQARRDSRVGTALRLSTLPAGIGAHDKAQPPLLGRGRSAKRRK